MKALPIVALVLALGALGTCVYGFVETKPNVKSNEARLATGSSGGEIGRLERAVLEDYRGALHMESYAGLGLGALALVLGGLAFVKKEKVAIAGAGAGLGAVGVVLAIVLGS